MEQLPTFWTPLELQLLVGTTLAPAMSAKLKSLRREYDHLCSSAAHTRWYQIVQDYIEFDDWLQVDAVYRSRALDFPQIGHCMVPCIDLANHASGEATIAVYEKDEYGDAVLLLRDSKGVQEGGEVTITYGDEKGACEMLFSYGFLEVRGDGLQSAETLFLSLAIPEDDVFRGGKLKIADSPPGFKLLDAGDGEIDWTGDFIWVLCVNQDDGIRFEIARTVDDDTEIDAFFEDEQLTGGAAQLHELLAKSELWDVYRLRAVTILQQRVFDQLQVLYTTEEDVEAVAHGNGTEIRDQVYEAIMTLRRLEFELMERAYEVFENQVRVTALLPTGVYARDLQRLRKNSTSHRIRRSLITIICHFLQKSRKPLVNAVANTLNKKIALAQSPVVVRYLANVTFEPQPDPEDFS